MRTMGFEWNKVRVLVTGASGFKGSWLSTVLHLLGATVTGLVRPLHSAHSAYEVLRVRDRIATAAIDVSNLKDVYDLLSTIDPEVIFHLGAKALVPSALRDPRRTFEVNVTGTINIIEACRQVGVASRVLLCSTDHVFGSVSPDELPTRGFNERSRVSYGGPYDTSKAVMELMARSYHYTYWDELPAIGITRCANVFGFGDINQRRIMPLFVRSSLTETGIPLKYRKSGRQFLHVTDAIAGYIKAAALLDEGRAAAKTGQPRPIDRSPFTHTFHFAIEDYGLPTPYISMAQLASMMKDLFQARIDDTQAIDYPENENMIQALDCAETKRVLGWQPLKSLEQGVVELRGWYEQENDLTALMRLAEHEVNTTVDQLAAAMSEPVTAP